nr:hypothetical protein [Mesorhizobium loti]
MPDLAVGQGKAFAAPSDTPDARQPEPVGASPFDSSSLIFAKVAAYPTPGCRLECFVMIRILIAAGTLALAGLFAAPASAQETFHGYDCTDDCSGHQAGYDWAAKNDITDERDCDGDSQSFNEGCQAYVEEQADDANRNSQSDDENDNQDSDD